MEQITVSEYVFKFLEEHGVKHVFTVVGGGCMHLTNALAKSNIEPVYMHHEQACAMAAEAYARVSNSLGVVLVTSGPGGTNALTGCLGSYMDSIPVMFISGNVSTNLISDSKLRQLGDQEFDIVSTVSNMTKMNTRLSKAEETKIALRMAYDSAFSTRPGPVWIDIPLDVQKATLDNAEVSIVPSAKPRYNSVTKIGELKKKLAESEKPLVIVGNGVRLSGATKEVRSLLLRNNIPVLTGINGNDIFGHEDSNYYGRFGILGQPGSNKILQEADLVLVLGSRLNIRQTGYNFDDFARNAYLCHVDIDYNEMHKKTLRSDLKIQEDISEFMDQFKFFELKQDLTEWHTRCKELKSSEVYNDILPSGRASVYRFLSQLSEFNKQKELRYPVVTSNGAANVVTMQRFDTNKEQRLITNTGCASMGYGLPASIGAAFVDGSNIICLEGDGSLQMNIQELQTIKHHNLPIWLFVLNNDGYNSIKLTQSKYGGGNFAGCDAKSGVSFPELSKIANAYGISYFHVKNEDIVNNNVGDILDLFHDCRSPVIFEVDLQTEAFVPKVGAIMKEDGTFIPGTLDNMEMD